MTQFYKSIQDVKIDSLCLDKADHRLLKDQQSFKRGDLDWVYDKSINYVKYVIDNVVLTNKFKYVFADIKVHNLKKGQVPALRNWHIDNFNEIGAEEQNHIFVSTNKCATEFLSKRVYFDSPIHSMNGLLINFPGDSIPARRWCSYTDAPHRATPAKKDCMRLLIKITESNTISPVNEVLEVTYK